MSDDLSASYRAMKERIFAAAEARAKYIRDTAERCVVCGKSMLRWGNRDRHFSCDEKYPLVGMICICPTGCSDTHVGNGRNPCHPRCQPCNLQAGRKLPKRSH